MARTVVDAELPAAVAASVLAPRNGLVAERPAGAGPPAPAGGRRGPAEAPCTVARFELAEGPLASYRRTVTLAPGAAPGFVHVTQVVELEVGLPYVSWLFAWPLRHTLGALRPARGFPWWSPPARMPHRAASTLAALCALSVLVGYAANLLPYTMTYAAGELGIGPAGQGVALGIVQLNAAFAVGLLALADRQGRRRLIGLAAAAAAVVTALGALAPDLAALTASQVVAGALLTTTNVLVGVVLVEEMPADARAWSVGVAGMCFGLGSGLALLALPLADRGAGGWRWLYVLALLALPALASIVRRLPESARFLADARRPPRWPGGRRRASWARAWWPELTSTNRHRLLVLGAGALLFAAFAGPAGQFQNEFLHHERHLSAAGISVLVQVTGTVGGLGTLVGGRLADRYGRRPVAAAGVALLGASAVASYFSAGAPLWVLSAAASFAAYGVTPVLAVYGGELFPTHLRGWAGGALTVLGAAGGLIGLAATGALTSLIGTVGPGLLVLAGALVALVALIVRAYPETAQAELESLNPEDRPLPA